MPTVKSEHKEQALILLKQIRAICQEMLDEDISRAETYILGDYADEYLFTLDADARMIQERVASIRSLKYFSGKVLGKSELVPLT
jgi:hypothetical protein